MLSASQSVVYRQSKPDLFAEVKLNRGNIFPTVIERKRVGKKLTFSNAGALAKATANRDDLSPPLRPSRPLREAFPGAWNVKGGRTHRDASRGSAQARSLPLRLPWTKNAGRASPRSGLVQPAGCRQRRVRAAVAKRESWPG